MCYTTIRKKVKFSDWNVQQIHNGGTVTAIWYPEWLTACQRYQSTRPRGFQLGLGEPHYEENEYFRCGRMFHSDKEMNSSFCSSISSYAHCHCQNQMCTVNCSGSAIRQVPLPLPCLFFTWKSLIWTIIQQFLFSMLPAIVLVLIFFSLLQA